MAVPALLLPYDPEVNNFGTRTLETESGQTITFEEASQNADYVKRALQLEAEDIPIEFTMFVLRKMAVNEKGFRSFEKALPRQAREYLQKLIGHRKSQCTKVHCGSDKLRTSTFRGIFIKVLCKKIISDSVENQEDTHYDELTTVFPFKVSRNVRRYKLKILQQFDADFYEEIQLFLNEHFDNCNAFETAELFLLNIRTFIWDSFSAESLLFRFQNPGEQHEDYLSTFPRLHSRGIERFQFLYREFDNAMRSHDFHVPAFIHHCDKKYFRELPECNFIDLYTLLEYTEFFQQRRAIYMERFKKYLFFFVHALEVDSNPVFFIDDLLFECLKSLRRYKTFHRDIVAVREDLVKITILHMRMNLLDRSVSYGRYNFGNYELNRVQEYILKYVVPENPRLNVNYKTDLLAWMPFRTDNACFNVCYSVHGGIKDLMERVLCSVLCPENEPVRCVISYNAYLGNVYQFDLPENIESLKNFIRLCNTYDVTDEPLKEPNHDKYILRLFLPFIETERVRATL